MSEIIKGQINNVVDCETDLLLKIVDTKIHGYHSEYKVNLAQYITSNKLNGRSFDTFFKNIDGPKLCNLLNIKDSSSQWMDSYLVKPIYKHFDDNVFLPITTSLPNNKNIRHVLKIQKHNIIPFTIINNNNNIDLLLYEMFLILNNMLKNINIILSNDIIKVILSFYENKSFIGVSFTKKLLNENDLKNTYKYLNNMDKKINDIRKIRFADIHNKEKYDAGVYFLVQNCYKYCQIHDIIDPSLFVKEIDKENNIYQWIPSNIKIINTNPIKVKINSSINMFKKKDNNKLFDVCENIISKMLPMFEDVTHKKLIKINNELQIICKVIQYNSIKDEHYGTKWHFEGTQNIEHVIAVGILYTHNDFEGNDCVSPGDLEFSMNTDAINDLQRKKPNQPKTDHFAIKSCANTCIVWNNIHLQHRLGFLQAIDKNGDDESDDNDESDNDESDESDESDDSENENDNDENDNDNDESDENDNDENDNDNDENDNDESDENDNDENDNDNDNDENDDSENNNDNNEKENDNDENNNDNDENDNDNDENEGDDNDESDDNYENGDDENDESDESDDSEEGDETEEDYESGDSSYDSDAFLDVRHFERNKKNIELKRQAIIFMLVDSNHKIKNSDENDFKISFKELKKRRKLVKEGKKGSKTPIRNIPYSWDGGSYQTHRISKPVMISNIV